MFRFRSGFSLAAVAIILAGAFAAQARPLTPAEGRYWPFSGEVPACNHEGVLGRIQGRFLERETKYWQSGLEIQGFNDIRESGLRTAGVDLIPRRFCKARAVMNDGKIRNVTYSIAENQGVIGWSWGVEWCVTGLDHHRAFGAGCAAAGP